MADVIDVREGRSYEKLFAIVKDPKPESLRGMSFGELIAASSLIMDGISSSLKDAAMFERGAMMRDGGITDPLSLRMALNSIDRQLEKLDKVLILVTSELDGRLPTSEPPKEEETE